MLAIWSLVPLHFLKPSWTSGSLWFVHVLLKHGLENFKHYFTSVWDECSCVVVWAFFGIAFLWDWKVIPVKPVENTIIAPLDCLCPFVKDPCLCRSISGLSALFHWSIHSLGKTTPSWLPQLYSQSWSGGAASPDFVRLPQYWAVLGFLPLDKNFRIILSISTR